MKLYAIRLVISLLTFAIGLISTALLQTPRFNAVSDGQVEQEILQVEREYIQAHLDRDAAALDNILADDFIFETRQGTESKAQRLALLDDADFGFEAINTSNVRVEVNGDSASVSGEAYTVTFNHDERVISHEYRFTREYEKRDGRWQIVRLRIGR